jgi:hypothetical protein
MAMLKKGLSYRRQGSSGLIWADNMIVAEDGTLILNRHKNNSNAVVALTITEKSIDASGDGGLMRSSGPRVSDASTMMMMSRSKSVGSASASAMAASSETVQIPPPPPSSSSSAAAPVPNTPSRPKSSSRVVKWLKKAITKIRR